MVNKYQSVTHVSGSIFQGLLKVKFLDIYSLNQTTFMGYFRLFLHISDFLPPCTLRISKNKFVHKKPFKFMFIESNKMSRWYCQKWECKGKIILDRRGPQTPPLPHPPPPACSGVRVWGKKTPYIDIQVQCMSIDHVLKGTDWLCKGVELSLLCSVVESLFRIHLRNIKLFKDP